MTSTDSWRGRMALMMAQCAGMVVLVALPVLVGTLITQYGLDTQQAGAMVTLFLAGAVVSSLFFAPRFNRIPGRLAATVGFALSGLAFAGIASTSDYTVMALLHGSAGIAAGCGLSVTHGTIGRSARPHRLFALVNTALGVFGILILGTTPRLVAEAGGPALFSALASVMLIAAVISALAFPQPERGQADARAKTSPLRIPASVKLGALGMGLLSLMNATAFSFVERIGSERGFGLEAVSGVLLSVGIVNLFPGPLAVLLERRSHARTVLFVGPVIHAALVLTLAQSTSFIPYAVGTCFLPAIVIFVNNFAFGLLARLDLSGRVLAASPAMVMIGAAVGPILGGTLVKLFGYGSLAIAVGMIAPLTLFCFAQIWQGGEAKPEGRRVRCGRSARAVR